MTRRAFWVIVWASTVIASRAPAQWASYDAPARPASDSQAVERGRAIYDERCVFCHGEDGDGNGPVAPYLWPRPRDFTIASFKLRSTGSGELPTDEDLYRTISLGMPGSAMPAWEGVLSPRDRWDVIAYLKTFSDGLFEDDAFDPYRAIVPVSDRPRAPRDELIARGRTVYETADCWECHGPAGRGDGEKGPELRDDWAMPISPTDLETRWRWRGGHDPLDVYLRLSTGLDGTPMPSYVQTLTDEERWAVAYYVASLDPRADGAGDPDVVITARYMPNGLPRTSDAEVWAGAPVTHLPLTGQATFAPRWQIPSVTDLSVQALYDDERIALRLTWNDRTADTVPAPSERARREGWTADDTYPVVWPDGERARGTFVDAAEVMFPASLRERLRLPHFVYGDREAPVEVWRWQASSRATVPAPVTRLTARGATEPPAPAETVSDGSVSAWDEGTWSVVIVRPRPEARTLDGNVLPIAFHVRDGGHGETGLRMSLSSWYYLYLERRPGAGAYLLVLLVVAVTVLAEVGVVRWVRRGADSETPRRIARRLDA